MKPVWLAAAALGAVSWGGLALAQTPAPAPVINETGVTAYPPAFFDEFHPTSALSMVTTIPGFSFDSGGGVARGQSANAGNVLIDGHRPPAGNDNLGSVLSRIPAEAVERIDVIRGGAPGIDMMGKPIVANVIRKRTASVSGAVSGNLGADSNGNLNYSIGANAQRHAGDTTLDGSANFNSSDGTSTGTSQRIGPAGELQQDAVNTGSYTFNSYGGNGAYERTLLGGNMRANLVYGHNNNDSDFGTLLIVPGGEQESISSGTSQNGELGLRYSYDLKSGKKLEAVFLQQFDQGSDLSTFETSSIASTFASDTRHSQSVLTGTIALPRKGKWTLDGGGEAAYNSFTSSSAYSLNGSPTFIPGDEITSQEVRTEVFGSATWSPTPKLNGQIAFRYERSTMTRDSSAGQAELTLQYLKPRASLSWRPKAGHELTLTVQRTVGQLGLGDFQVSANAETGTGVATNPYLEPEKAWTLDARYQRTWGRRGNFTLSYNLRQVANPTALAFKDAVFDYRINIPAARYHTLRVSANVPLEPFGLKDNYLSISASLRESERLDPTTGVSSRASGEAPYDWSFGYSQERNMGKFIWRIGVNGRPETEGYGVRSTFHSSGSVFANASLTWRPTDITIFSASISGSLLQSESQSALFLGKRTDNILRYTTFSQSENVPSASISLRRSF